MSDDLMFNAHNQNKPATHNAQKVASVPVDEPAAHPSAQPHEPNAPSFQINEPAPEKNEPSDQLLSPQQEVEEITKLRKEIEHHSYLYYAQDAPEISDAAFDSLMRRLRELEHKHPECYDPNSPTMRVGGYVDEQFMPVQHAERMYSLDNAMDLNELDV